MTLLGPVALLLVGCGGTEAAPSIETCFSGDFFAECGGTGESRFACRPDGECKWFVGGTIAEDFSLVSECPATDLCCEDRWPFAEMPDSFGAFAVGAIEAGLYGGGTLPWDRIKSMALEASVNESLDSNQAISCSGGGIELEGSPCDAGTTVRVRRFMEDTLAVFFEPSGWFVGWDLWLEVDPETALARVCIYYFKDDFRQTCYGGYSPACATTGELILQRLPTGFEDVSSLAGSFEATFDDGLSVSASF
jgi:hypothetical protein